jgi:hypothetical protein
LNQTPNPPQKLDPIQQTQQKKNVTFQPKYKVVQKNYIPEPLPLLKVAMPLLWVLIEKKAMKYQRD